MSAYTPTKDWGGWSEALVANAAHYATNAHFGQKRKYNDKPYITHPERVASKVASLPDSTPEMVAAAWLHDTVEDCGKSLIEIESLFGPIVASLVHELTNPSKDSKAPRAERKAQDLAHLATISKEAKHIKLIDRLDNLMEIDGSEPKFIALYCKESRALLGALNGTDSDLEDAISQRITALRN